MTLNFLRKRRKQRLGRKALWSKNGHVKAELEAASAPPGSTHTWALQSAHNNCAELSGDPLRAAEVAAPNNGPVYEIPSLTTPEHWHAERHEMDIPINLEIKAI
jgi:hypothetical protein